MCDPMSIIGIGLSVGMAVMQAQQQQDLINKQNDANEQWLAYQRRKSQDENRRQESLRLQAEAAREGTLSELTPQAQTDAQQNEATRLKKDITPQDVADMAAGNQQTLNDKMLSGQGNSSVEVQTSVKNQLAQAAKDARSRIAALATLQSYGGSQYGLTNRANTIFNSGNQDIRLAGDERQGSLGAYGVEKAVEPIHYVATPSGFGGASSAL